MKGVLDALEAIIETINPEEKPEFILTKEDAVNWHWSAKNTKQKEMLAAAIEWKEQAIHSEPDPLWLVFLGRPGTGKTHLAHEIDNRLPENDYDFKNDRWGGDTFIRWPDLLNNMREGNYSGFNNACRDQWLVLDDIGTDCLTNTGPSMFAIQKLCMLLDSRLRLPTVITSNFSVEDFAKQFDERIASRLLRCSRIVETFSIQDFNL